MSLIGLRTGQFLRVVGRPPPRPVSCDGSDGAGKQLIAMPGENIFAGPYLLPGVDVHQPNDAAMGTTENDGELAKILVESDQDSGIALRCLKDRIPLAHPDYVMPGVRSRTGTRGVTTRASTRATASRSSGSW